MQERDTPFPDIVETLEVHHPTSLEITESFRFGTRHQKSNELKSDFVVALKQLSTHCNYGDFRIQNNHSWQIWLNNSRNLFL